MEVRESSPANSTSPIMTSPVTILNVDVIALVVLVVVVSAASCICTVLGHILTDHIKVRRLERNSNRPRVTSRCAGCRRLESSRPEVTFGFDDSDANNRGRESFALKSLRRQDKGRDNDHLSETFLRLGISTSDNGKNRLHPLASNLENRDLSPIQQTPPGTMNGSLSDMEEKDLERNRVRRLFPLRDGEVSREHRVTGEHSQDKLDVDGTEVGVVAAVGAEGLHVLSPFGDGNNTQLRIPSVVLDPPNASSANELTDAEESSDGEGARSERSGTRLLSSGEGTGETSERRVSRNMRVAYCHCCRHSHVCPGESGAVFHAVPAHATQTLADSTVGSISNHNDRVHTRSSLDGVASKFLNRFFTRF